MGLHIITADERQSEARGIKGLILGPHGIGKTSLLWTLPPKTTLFLNLEAGELAIQDCPVDSIDVRKESLKFGKHPWDFSRALACVLCGPDPSAPPESPYSQANYAQYIEHIGPTEMFAKYETIFVDSISVAGRHAFSWSKTQPQAFSEKTGKPDNRGAYGLLGQEMITWLTTLQHISGKNVWLVGGLDKKTDDFGRPSWTPQIEGGKTGLEMPGIVDEVISMVELDGADGAKFRAFVCQTLNPGGYPAKDRSGRLALLERPHLGELMAKIAGPKPASNGLVYQDPPSLAAPTPMAQVATA